MIKIAICDDDKMAVPVIAGAIESAFQNQNVPAQVRAFFCAQDLLSQMDKELFRLVFLDIDMEGPDGIDTGKQIRSLHQNAEIIYVSGYEQRVFETFAVHPFGFVRKSHFLSDLSDVVRQYLEQRPSPKNSVYINFSTRTKVIALCRDDVRYIEGSRNYQNVYLDGQDEPVEVKMTMDKLEELTMPHGFIRIHKGYLANYRFIQRICTKYLILQDGTQLPIGRSRGHEIKERYLTLLKF